MDPSLAGTITLSAYSSLRPQHGIRMGLHDVVRHVYTKEATVCAIQVHTASLSLTPFALSPPAFRGVPEP